MSKELSCQLQKHHLEFTECYDRKWFIFLFCALNAIISTWKTLLVFIQRGNNLEETRKSF